MKKILFAFTLALTLMGCVAHLSQQQCISTDWQREGFNDGAAGIPLRDLTQATKDCQQYNIPLNHTAYITGWHQGIKNYCTPDFNLGVTEGQQGTPDSAISNRVPICMQAGTPLNSKNYERGRRIGLQTFCTYDKGVSIARQGSLLPDVCTGHLQSAITQGWKKGAEQFCNQLENAFALGKAGQPYPAACPPHEFFAFKSEYDRGTAIAIRITDLQAKITDINKRIAEKVAAYGFEQTDKGYIDSYKLGFNKSAEAEEHLKRVKNLLEMKHNFENQLFPLQVMK